MPLVTDVVPGSRADDPLYVLSLERVKASLGQSGLLYVGDCKMASRQTRAWVVSQGDYYLCPLPQVQLAEGELEAALEAVERREVTLSPVCRESSQTGQVELIAEGYERQEAMTFEAGEHTQNWTERRLVVRSVRHAKAAEAELRARVAQAKAQVEALNQRGRGRKRFEEPEELRQAVHEMVQRHGVEAFLWLRYDQQRTSRPVRAYQGRAAEIKYLSNHLKNGRTVSK